MAEKSNIEWCDSTLNWWEGCTKVGPGCDHCYAEARNARFGGGAAPNWGPGAPRRLTSEHNRSNLRRWNKRPFCECPACGWRGEERDANTIVGLLNIVENWCPECHKEVVKPARRRVFCSSLSDVFDNEAPQEWRDALFAEMEAAPDLDFLVLTKRIANVRKMVPARWLERGGWPAHVRLGLTVVTQEEADRDIPKLLAVPARVRFLSCEPLLGPVRLTSVGRIPADEEGPERIGYMAGPDDGKSSLWPTREEALKRSGLHWVIVGGESGPNARPMSPQWARDLRDQCRAAGVPFLFKQWGEWLPMLGQMEGVAVRDHATTPDGWVMGLAGKKLAGRQLDGVEHNGYPEAGA